MKVGYSRRGELLYYTSVSLLATWVVVSALKVPFGTSVSGCLAF